MSAYYRAHLPSGAQETNETGEIRFRFVPKGAEEGEDVTVTVKPGEIQINETVKAGKKAKK